MEIEEKSVFIEDDGNITTDFSTARILEVRCKYKYKLKGNYNYNSYVRGDFKEAGLGFLIITAS